MRFVPDPLRRVLLGVVRVLIVGRTDEEGRRRDALVVRPPLRAAPVGPTHAIIVLDPDAPECFDGGDMAQPLWRSERVCGGKEHVAIRANGQRPRLTRRLARRQTIVLGAPAVALKPG